MYAVAAGLTDADAVALLATTAGISGVVFVVMNLIRPVMQPETFDRFAPLLAVVVGIVLSIAYAVVTTSPLTGTAVLGSVVSGLLGGALSQNVNTAVRRALPA